MTFRALLGLELALPYAPSRRSSSSSISCCDFTWLSLPPVLALHFTVVSAHYELNYRSRALFTASLSRCSSATLLTFSTLPSLEPMFPLVASSWQSPPSSSSCCGFIWLSLPLALALRVTAAPALYALIYALQSALPLAATSRRSLSRRSRKRSD